MRTFTDTVEEALARLTTEDLAGAAACYHLALDCLEIFASHEVEEPLRETLLGLALRIAQAKPSMIALRSACDHCLRAADQGSEDPLRAVRLEVKRLRQAQKDAERVIATKAQRVIPARARVMTISASGTVKKALLMADSIEVAVTVSEPRGEGKLLAEELTARRIAVTLGPDDTALALLASCQVVLVGADTVGNDVFINKVGTLALALGARHLGIPFYVLADRTKFTEEAPKEGPLFEAVPRLLVTEVISD